MIRSKIIYTLLLLICIIFFILYIQPFSLYLLIFVALLPIFLGVSTLIAKCFITAEISSKSEFCTKNTDIQHVISIKNKTPLPFSNCIIKIEYYNKLMNIKDSAVFHIPIHPLCTQKLTFALKSQFSGILTVNITSMKIFDYLKLFSVRKRINTECSTTIIPELYLPQSKSNSNLKFTEDNDTFSKTKSGDDPSEIFALKDYVPGDKPNRIHWNLSLKHDNLIVRHYSQPICTSYLLMFDFCGNASAESIEILDTAADTAFSVAFLLLEKAAKFNLAFFNNITNSVDSTDITSENDIINAFRNIFKTGLYTSGNTVSFLNEHINDYSEIIYISPDEEHFSAVINLNNDSINPIIIRNDYAPLNADNNISAVFTGNTERGISNLII